MEHRRVRSTWNIVSSHPLSVTAVLAGLLFFLPFLLQWDRAYFEFDDNLDSVVPWSVVLARSGQLFSFSNAATIPNIMAGIPRNAYPASLNIVSWISRPSRLL